MDVEEFKQKYEELKDNPMYKNFCSILDTKNQVLERIAKENQELKKENESLRQLQCTFLGTGCKRKMEEYESQQKEFIEWLEKETKIIENKLNKYNELVKQGKETDIEYYLSIIDERKFDIYMKTLRKYKEIIGNIYESDISS